MSEEESSSFDQLKRLLDRCDTLQASLSSFTTLVASHGAATKAEFRPFATLLSAERRFLERNIKDARHKDPGGGHTAAEPPVEQLSSLEVQDLKAAEHQSADDRAASDQALDNDEDSDSTPDQDSGDEGSTRPTTSSLTHVLRSSNLPYLEAVWSAAITKSGGAVTALHKRFRWEAIQKRIRPSAQGAPSTDTQASDAPNPAKGTIKGRSVLVDVVSRNGQRWTKVSTVTERRLIFELAREGWNGEDSEYDEPSEEDEPKSSPIYDTSSNHHPSHIASEPPPTSIERLSLALLQASSHTRVHFLHPTVHFILPRLREGRTPAVDNVLARMRKMGAQVHCGELPRPSARAFSDEADAHMLPSDHPPLTPTLNVDCTVLLALVSDVSHGTVAAPDSAHPSVAKQMDRETKAPLLPGDLYPKFRGREMVTCEEAAVRMREIVGVMGTANERARAAILLGEGGGGEVKDGEISAEDLRSRWNRYTAHPGPADLMLPIRIVSVAEAAALEAGLTPMAEKVLTRLQLSAVNRGVWMLGWAGGWVSVTSNRGVARQVKAAVESALDEEEEERGVGGGERDGHRGGVGGQDGERPVLGPAVWVVSTARSLVGREMKRRQ